MNRTRIPMSPGALVGRRMKEIKDQEPKESDLPNNRHERRALMAKARKSKRAK